MQAQVPTPIEENEEPEEEKQERREFSRFEDTQISVTFLADSVRERVAWGSKEDIAELNEDILQCLEIEEIPEPTKFFSKRESRVYPFLEFGVFRSVETFPNVAAYYFDIISQLDDAGIDLYASLRSHLGEDHDLVQGVQKEMEETKKSPFRRESTAMAEELRQVGAGILVPGVQAFSEESRAMSWVVRTGPILPHAKSREESQGPLGTVEGSVTSHNRHSETTDQTPYHPRPNPILCPGLPVSYNELDRPNSYHGPPIHVPSPKHKRSLLKRIKNCFCFIS